MKYGNLRPFAVILSIAALVFLLSPLHASAQGDDGPRFRLGALEIHPSVEVSVKEDDNIFLKTEGLTPEGKKSDTILTYVPAINFKLPFGADSSLSGGFKYEILDFSDFNNEDTENATATASLKLEKIGGKFYSRTNGTYEDTSDPSSSETQSVTGARTPRTKFEVDTQLGYGGYDGGKLRLEVNGGYTENRYDRSLSDRLENDLFRLGGLVEIAISPKTNIRVDYEFEDSEYNNRTVDDQRDDAEDHTVRAGFSFSPSALITGHATVGAAFKKFDQTISTTSTNNRDQTAISADVDLTWNARPLRTTVNFTFASSIENSSTPGQFGFRKWSAGGRLTQGLLFISDNLEATFAPSYERNEFLRNPREDTIVKLKADLKYTSPSKRFPWFAQFLYERGKKTTNIDSLKDSIDYTQNKFEFKVGLAY